MNKQRNADPVPDSGPTNVRGRAAGNAVGQEWGTGGAGRTRLADGRSRLHSGFGYRSGRDGGRGSADVWGRHVPRPERLGLLRDSHPEPVAVHRGQRERRQLRPVADIDASETSSWNGGSGFAPIGSTATPFTGTLDGNGHTVTGLTISRSGTNDVGVFGYVGIGGEVTDVAFLNLDVTGGDPFKSDAGRSPHGGRAR